MDSYSTTAKKTSGEFERITPGLHQAVCVGVHGLGLQKSAYQGVERIVPKVRLIWELKKKDSKGTPFFITKTYTLSLNEKSTLFKDLKDWRGKAFTAEELEAFEVKNVEGANCMLNIVFENEYTNVSSISPLIEDAIVIKKSVDVPEGIINKVREKQNNAVSENYSYEAETELLDSDPPIGGVPF